MKKLLKSQNGSSMAYILVVVTILIVLSGSLITMTVANYRLGLIKGGRNTAFYFADGAIDEALAEVEELSHRAEVEASRIVQDEDAAFKDTPEWNAFEKWLEDNMEPEPEGDIGDTDDDAQEGTSQDDDSGDKTYLSADEASALYSQALNKEFQKQYLLYLLKDGVVDEDYQLVDEVDGKDQFIVANDMTFTYNSTSVLKDDYLNAIRTVKFDPSGKEEFSDIEALTTKVSASYRDTDKAIRLTIETGGKFNIYNKGVEVVVDMVPPTYDYVTISSVVQKEMKTNDILENALTAKEDIVVIGGPVETHGDIYALGTFENNTAVNHLEKGGVVVGYEPKDNYLDLANRAHLSSSALLNGSGALTVNGNIKTVSSVKPGASNSIITVKGSVFADSFIVHEVAEKTITNIEDNMFLMDDLLIKGKETSLLLGDDPVVMSEGNADWVITDSVLTYLDGADYEQKADGTDAEENGALKNPDLSSSIRVNKSATGSKIALDFVYVPGVAYVDVYRTQLEDDKEVTKFFQTGESFTAENNFFFYQNELEEQEDRTEEVIYTDGENFFGLIEYVDENGTVQDSAAYKADHFLNSIREEYEKPEDIRDMTIVPTADKEIMTIRSMTREIADGSSDTDDYHDNYAKGVILGNGRVYNPKKMDDVSEFKDIMLPSNITSDLQTGLLGYRDYRKGELKTDILRDGTETDMLDEYIDFSKSTEFSTINRSGVLIALAEDRDVYINVPTSHIPSGDHIVYNYNDKDIKGVVATKGDIYIYNSGDDLTFKGSLIAGGSIIFYGNGKKIIDNIDENIKIDSSPTLEKDKGLPLQSRAYVYGIIGSYDQLIDAFHTLEGRKLIVKKYADTSSFTRSIYFNIAYDIVDQSYKYDDMDSPNGPQLSVGTVDISNMSTPQLDGASKEKNTKGYELVLWHEVTPSN